MDKSSVIIKINDAFPIANPPANNHIVKGMSGEAMEIRAMLSGKRWNELKIEVLVRQNSALGFLTDEAFCYYIPAYLLLLLQDLRAADILASSVIRHLTLPVEVDAIFLANFLAQSGNLTNDLSKFLQEELRNSSSRVGGFIQRMKRFTQPQGEAINEFLKFLAEQHADYYDEGEPSIARTRYWVQYDK
jgi:hypothetical protein